MVDILVDWETHFFDLSGDAVEMELRPLETGAVFQLMAINLESPDAKQLEVLLDIFSNYVRGIKNLTVGGKPATPADIVNISQLMGLCGEVTMKLTQISNLQTADKKK